MLTRTLGIATLALAAAAAPARADIMHWFWEVEVNDQPVDARSPVAVEVGDLVEIDIWTEFTPYHEGFAWAVFSVHASDDFFRNGEVSIDRWRGYGLNTDLDGFGDPGFFADADSSGYWDTIDHVVPAQFPPFFNSEFDPSNPLRTYRIGWTVESSDFERIELSHGTSLAGEYGAAVYFDPFGAFAVYDSTSTTLVIVPSPHSLLVVCLGLRGVLLVGRRR